ncbi:MAG: hypothetical protein IJ412_03365 [Oscillospiraceae bacterium]|nr:hypothetical protein [Oscillospiraceae bacterium]
MKGSVLQVLMTKSDAAQDLALHLLLRQYGIELTFYDSVRSIPALRHNGQFDAVVVRCRSSELGSAALMARYHSHLQRSSADPILPQLPVPFIAILFSMDAAAAQMLRDAGYCAVLQQPFSEYALASAILQHVTAQRTLYANKLQELENFYREHLIEMGCPVHLAGFRYLLHSLLYLSVHPDALHQMTKVLYPYVAQLENTSAGCVERSMRTALERLWENGNREKLAALMPAHFTPNAIARRASIGEFLAAVITQTTLVRHSG